MTAPGTAKPKPGVDDAPVVTLRQGTYIGATLASGKRYAKAVEAFQGIPYAQNTAGRNRFHPPVPLPPGTETHDAVAFGQVCPNAFPRTVPPEGEDCLNLNLYRPADQNYENPAKVRAMKMPVVVYVHGGSFNSGAGMERNMGSFVAWADQPIIGVSFNYRVGALGFLPSALTAREGVLNLGLRDQQFLFEWVKQNVAYFGGDPDNVTIMGLSAGAHSVGHQVMYYSQLPGPAPFAKAIIESGATTARAVFHPTHPRHLIQFREFLIEAGAEGVAEEDVFETLRSMSLPQVIKASRAVWKKYERDVTWPFQPTTDGPNALANSSQPVFKPNSSTAATVYPAIPDLPVVSWRQGKHLRIPLLTGFNTNEGAIFVPSQLETNDDFRAFFQTLIPAFNKSDLDALEALYPDPVTVGDSPYRNVPAGKGKQWARLDAAYSHYAYICPVIQTAHFLSTSTDASGSRPPVYVYHFAATALFGVTNHGDEAPLVAHDTNRIDSKEFPGLHATADAMHGAWVRFAATGDPNPLPGPNGGGSGANSQVTWPVFESPFPRDEGAGQRAAGRRADGGSMGQVMFFGKGNDERRGKKGHKAPGVPAEVGTLSALESEACRFWWDRIELSEGVGKRRDELEQRQAVGKRSLRAKL
ncbi:alpha/beta-hydrolase [Thozetella sp. PMI_491]|nr:alpha/beta-hydrolase [Thozetella sp. PMI_491]